MKPFLLLFAIVAFVILVTDLPLCLARRGLGSLPRRTMPRLPSRSKTYGRNSYGSSRNTYQSRSSYPSRNRVILSPRPRLVPSVQPRLPYIRPRPMIFWAPLFLPMYSHHYGYGYGYGYGHRNRLFYSPKKDTQISSEDEFEMESVYFGCSQEKESIEPYWCSTLLNSTMFFSDSTVSNAKTIDVYLFTLSNTTTFRILIYGLTSSSFSKRDTESPSSNSGVLLFDSDTACTPWNISAPCVLPLLPDWKAYQTYQIYMKGDTDSSCLENYWFKISWFTDDFVSVFSNATLDDVPIERNCPAPVLAVSNSTSEDDPSFVACLTEISDYVNNSCPLVEVDPDQRRSAQAYGDNFNFSSNGRVSTSAFVIFFGAVVLIMLIFRYKFQLASMCNRITGRGPATIQYPTTTNYGQSAVPMHPATNQGVGGSGQYYSAPYPPQGQSNLPYPLNPQPGQPPYPLNPQTGPPVNSGDKPPSYEEALRQ